LHGAFKESAFQRYKDRWDIIEKSLR